VTSQQQPTKAMKASSAAANKGQQTPYVWRLEQTKDSTTA
jgi:hypothetical protein